MNKKVKKILIASASLLMLSSVGAGVNQVNGQVHASRRSYLRAKKHHNYKRRSYKRKRTVRHKRAKRRIYRHYTYQSGGWFVQNARNLYKRYKSRGLYAQARNNVKYGTNLNLSNANKPLYRYGWIISYANNSQGMPSSKKGGTAQGYNRAKQVYYAGLSYARSHHARHVQYSDYLGAWHKAL